MRFRGLALALACALLCGLTACTDHPNPSSGEAPGGPVLSDNAISPASEEAGAPFESLEDILPEPSSAADAKQIELFALTVERNAALPFNVACHVGENDITALLPAGVERGVLVPDIVFSGEQLLCQGESVVPGETAFDLRQPVALTVVAEDGSKRDVMVRVETLATGIPSVALTTTDYTDIQSREVYQTCSFYVGGGDNAYCPYAMEKSIVATGSAKGRGNTTWSQPKRGYTVQLDEQVPLLDMPKSRHWALVANFEDKSLIRNYLANYLAEQAGIAYVMQIRPVDLWYNGQYWGSYNLCEKVEIEKERVNITKFDPELTPEESGYLLEFDGHVNEVDKRQKALWEYYGSAIHDPVTNETFLSVSIGSKWLTIKKPSYQNLREEDTYYVDERLSEAIIALNEEDYTRIAASLDVESFVRWYLVEEFMNNADSSMHSSVYMTLDAGGKFQLGPVWDFDRSSGNCDYWNAKGDPDSLYKSGAGWFHLLFKNKEARDILLREWEAFSGKLDTLNQTIDAYAGMLSVSQQLNFELWDILDRKVGSNSDESVKADTYEKQVQLLKDYLTDRRSKMDTYLRKACR